MESNGGLRTNARFGELDAKAGHYESFYLKASHPAGGKAAWIRHTIHKRPGAEPDASLWVTLFDADSPGPVATKATYPADQLTVPTGAYVKAGPAVLEPGRAHCPATDSAPAASWDLTFAPASDSFHHLPRDFMYSAKLPRTKMLSPYPYATYTGTVTVGGRTLELDAWPGMVGHNWGSEHAERWVWIQAACLNGVEGDYLDIAVGKIKIGPWTTPWVANGMLVLDGEPHRLGGLDKVYGTDLDEAPGACEFTFPGKNVTVKGKVSAPNKDFVGWVYADPDGPEHNTINCSISDLELRVERPSRRHAHIELAGAAAYELGMRETDHGIPLQPFADG